MTRTQWIHRLRRALASLEELLASPAGTLRSDAITLRRIADELHTRLSDLESAPWPSPRGRSDGRLVEAEAQLLLVEQRVAARASRPQR